MPESTEWRQPKIEAVTQESVKKKKKVIALEEKSVIGCDGGKFLNCRPKQIVAFCLDDFMFCNGSKLETVGKQSNQITL